MYSVLCKGRRIRDVERLYRTTARQICGHIEEALLTHMAHSTQNTYSLISLPTNLMLPVIRHGGHSLTQERMR